MHWKILNLLLATGLFVGAHFMLSAQPLRARLHDRLGERGFLAVYTLVSLVLFVWMVAAYALSPRPVLWTAPLWLHYLPLVIMPFALLLIAGGYAAVNPMAVGQEAALDAAQPQGVALKITRHPAMWGIALWAGSHLLVNGDAASIVLFGGMLVLALGGAAHIDSRRRRAYPERFARYAALTSFVPFAALWAGRSRLTAADVGWLPVLAALVAYLVLLLAHQTVIGVPPWPH